MARAVVSKEDDSNSPSGSNNSSGHAEQKTTKRRCVQSACVPCRKRKSKCDGSTPVCATCTAVYKTECHYDAESENRRSKAGVKRDSTSLVEPKGAADIIIASIRSLPELEVQEIIQQIRRDDNLDSLADSLRKIVTLPPKSDGKTSLEGDLSVLIGKPAVTRSGVSRHYGHTSSLGLVKEDENYSIQQQITSPITPGQENWTTVTKDLQFLYHLFDLYFRWSHPFYVLFSRECFYKDFKSGRQKYCSPLLVNAICAFACHFSDDPAGRTDPKNPRTAGDHFFAEARRLLYEDETPCLTTVQALAVMGLREPSAGRDSSGFMYAGRCLRMVVELGLHLNFASAATLGLTKSEIEVRKVTFWGCFTYDTAWSLAIGRISQLPRTAINLEKPILDEPVTLDSKFQNFITDGDQRGGILTNRQFLQQISTLSELVNDAVFMFYAPRERFTSRRLLECHKKYTNWYRALPRPLQLPENPERNPAPPHVLTLHMYYYTCNVHLFRPLLKVDLLHSDIRPRDMCFQSANKVSEILRIYRQHYSLRCVNLLLTHILLSSCTVHLINYASATASRNLAEGLRALEDISTCHHFGTRAFKIIYALSQKWGLPFPEDILKNTRLILSDENAMTSPPADTFFAPIVNESSAQPAATDGYSATTAGATTAVDGGAEASAKDPSRRESLTMFATVPSAVPSPTSPHHQRTHSISARSSTPLLSNIASTLASSANPALAFHPATTNMASSGGVAPAEQLFWTPFQGQGVPLLGNNIHVSPMDLSSMLGAVDDWESFSRDGFKISESWALEGEAGFSGGGGGGGGG
ncbi:hypothetical protein K432DRAFT_338562, partial [Lepidopterella palustris CBS 459.81]